MASLEKEFFWGCQLSKDKNEQEWNSEDEKLSKLDIDQKLLLTNACLGAKAKQNEQNIVEVTTTDVSENKLTCTIVCLQRGTTEQCRLGLTFPSSVVFKLVEGSGPVHLSGSVYQELYLSEGDESESSEEGEDSAKPLPKVLSKKRPLASETPKGPPKKLARVEAEDENKDESDEDEDDDDDDDDDDEDEAESTSEESEKMELDTKPKQKKPVVTPKTTDKKSNAKLTDKEVDEKEEDSEEEESEEEGESGEDESDEESEDEDEEESEEDESVEEDEVAASLTAKGKKAGKEDRKKPVTNGVGKTKASKKLDQEKGKQVKTLQPPSTPKGTGKGEAKKAGSKTPQTPDINKIKEKLLTTPNLPKKPEKFKNYMKSSFKVTDEAAISDVWDWLQKNKK